MNRVTRRILLVAALAAALCAGCSSSGNDSGESAAPTTPGTPPQRLPAGYHRIGGPGNGLTVAVPKTWKAANLTAEAGQRLLRQAGLTASAAKKTITTLTRNHAVFAYDTKTARRGFAANLNGFCTTSSGATTAQLKTAMQLGLKRIGATNIEVRDTAVGGRPAVRASYSRRQGRLAMDGVQYQVMAANARTCQVTMTARHGVSTAEFDEIAPTIRPL